MEMQHKAKMAQLDAAEKIHMQRIFSAEGMQKLALNQAQGEQKLQQMKEQKSLQNKNGGSGKTPAARKKSTKP